jgi:transcriptional regulator with XRE-family HTH domain
MTPMARVAKRLKQLRARGWSQASLARRAGVSREHLARLETCHYDPTLGTLTKLARALGIPVRDLV